MRSFSCWRATRVRARPLSPLLDAPALHTLYPLPNLNLTTPSFSRAERLFPPQPLPLWGRMASPLHLSAELAGGTSRGATLKARHLGP